jgi:putative ABC transport system permease protein
MFNHYLTTALRYFGRNKFTTSINVVCLTLGMTCFAAAYGVVAWFTNADRHYANSDHIFFISEGLQAKGTTTGAASSPFTSWVTGNVVRANLPQLSAVARLMSAGDAPISVDEGKSTKNAFVATAFADPQFLDIFTLPFVSGDATAALTSPHSAIVTAAMAQRVFGSANVIGKTMLLRNRERIVITGVVANFKQPSHFGSGTALVNIEMIVSMDTYESIVRATSSPTRTNEALATWGANMGSFLYVLTPNDGSIKRDTLNAWFETLTKNHAPTETGTFHLQAHPIWELYSSFGDGIAGTQQTGVSSATVLLLLGGLILLVSCINYANLATAQVATRSKEVAMRRIVGAGRMEIIRQYLFETALLTLLALILVLTLSLLLLGVLGSMLNASLIGVVLLSGNLWLLLVMALTVVTLTAGAYPAFVLSRMRPLQALKTGGTAGPKFVPTILVGVQFGVASFLLVALLVMFAQNRTLQEQRAAVSGEPILAITTNLKEAGIDLQVLSNELRRNEHIELVAAADAIPGSIMTFNHRLVSGSQDANAARIFVSTDSIDAEYFKTLSMQMLAGRNFDSARGDEWDQNIASPNDVMNVVINRLMAQRAGWTNPSNAVGQTIYGQAGLGEHTLTMRVIGVVETKALALLGPFGSLATVYTLEPERAHIPIVRLSKAHAQEGIAELEATWKKLAPNIPLRREFLDESFARTFRFMPIISNAFAGLALFAFFISAMGLVGMATHVTARRTREIGVRKTLGASVTRILGLLLRDFSKPVLIANVLMWPLAYIVMQGYLSLFMVQASLSVLPFVLGLLITVGIACASVVVQATKAARLNPAMVLRTE